MSSIRNVVMSACTALSLYSCQSSVSPTEQMAVVPPMPLVQVMPAKVDAGAPIVPTVVQVTTPVDTLALSHETPAVDHLRRAQQLSEEGDFVGALTEARRALFTSPQDVQTLTVVAKLARRAHQPELAIEAWDRVARLEPEDATPLIQQARAAMQAKDFAAAELAGEEAVTRDVGNAEAYQVMGIAQLSMGQLANAIASFEQAVAVDPNHGWALNNLGFACLRANQNERAVQVLERAAELLPQTAVVHNNLGVALERLGRGDEAKTAYQQAMDLSPKYVKAKINAARVAKVQLPEEPQLSDENPVVE